VLIIAQKGRFSKGKEGGTGYFIGENLGGGIFRQNWLWARFHGLGAGKSFLLIENVFEELEILTV